MISVIIMQTHKIRIHFLYRLTNQKKFNSLNKYIQKNSVKQDNIEVNTTVTADNS